MIDHGQARLRPRLLSIRRAAPAPPAVRPLAPARPGSRRWCARFRADLLDGVAQFAAEHHLGVLLPAVQPLVEHRACRSGHSQTSFSSRSFWMKPRNSDLSKNSGAAGAYSRHRRCAARWHRRFQFAGAQRARAVLDQRGDGDEVALERLLQAVARCARRRNTSSVWPGAAREDAAVVVADRLQQALGA